MRRLPKHKYQAGNVADDSCARKCSLRRAYNGQCSRHGPLSQSFHMLGRYGPPYHRLVGLWTGCLVPEHECPRAQLKPALRCFVPIRVP